ncbi:MULTISPECIES: hypothetical protein [unclassified Moraxella]|uniref:hypothetical protein n=1 Tax=unclassified Moraxella TaxID=2685852 RepID=UPI002B40F0CF|nr:MULTISPECIES: hypothetical protein [unclassified Moraxella]
MLKITPHTKLKSTSKFLFISILAALAMPAHSVWISTPNVRDGLQLYVGGSVNPRLSTTSDKFNYTMADPAIYGKDGTLADVLADQDRKDADERLKAEGLDDAGIELYVTQALTKKLKLGGTTYLYYNQNSSTNYGALWGVSLDFGSFGELGRVTVGDGWTRLPVKQTDVDNILQSRGTNISARYTKIPNLTLAGYHLFNASPDVNSRYQFGLHKSSGVSAGYEFDFGARNNLTLAAGYTKSEGHKDPYYAEEISQGESYLVGIGLQDNNLKLGLDYGQRNNKYNGFWWDNLNTKVYGVKATYEFTPRLSGTLSYAHKTDTNGKAVSFKDLAKHQNVNEAQFFEKVKQDRYLAKLEYQLYKNISLNGEVSNTQTKNYVTEGEFSKRDRLYTSVGASFSF